MSQDWNNPDFQADIAREAMQADHKIEELQAQVKRLETMNAISNKILQALVDLPLYAYTKVSAPISLIADISEIRGAAKMALREALIGPSQA